jgi:outer membrane receptor for ferrienterochelin and colicins
MKNLFTILILVIFNQIILLSASQVTLVGKVTDEENRPVKEGTVLIEGSSKMVAVTDSTGYFYIKNITPGIYSLSVKSEGYDSHKEELTIADNEVMTINIILKKHSDFFEDLAIKIVELIIQITK